MFHGLPVTVMSIKVLLQVRLYDTARAILTSNLKIVRVRTA